MKPFLLFILICMGVLSSCGEQQAESTSSKPDWVLDENKMVDIIVDLRIADAAVYLNTNMPPRDKVKDWAFIMKKHQIHDSIFRKSHDYYAAHPEIAEDIYEQVIDRLNEMVADNQDN
ncbi:MAG: DUF4296 domain-containing protein [Bacteroidetes bacterium]|nr:DUF4296 domain-containing protein [Bacteroidota bacterium]